MRNILTLSILMALLATPATQARDNVELDSDWARAEHFTSDTLQQYVQGTNFYINWIEGTPCFYYSTRQGGKMQYKLGNASTGKVKPFFKDPVKYARDYTRLTGDTVTAEDINMYGFKFKPGYPDSFTFKRKGKTFRYDMRSGKLSGVKKAEEEKTGKPLSFGKDHTNADSTITMMGCGYDMYYRDNRTGIITRLTTDGKEDASHTYSYKPDTLDSNISGWWAGNRYINPLYDSSDILETGIIETIGHERPKVNKYRMPMPGDTGVKRTKIYWFNPETGEGRYLPIEKYPDQVVDINYHRSPEAIYFTRRSRAADAIDLCRINVPDGTVSELISEECKPHMNMTLFNYRLLDGGNRILWWSERTGRGNYYLYDGEGNLLNRITLGDNLVAGPVLKMDSVAGAMIFLGYGNEPGINPYYQMYYSAKYDGTGQTLLTPGNATHDLRLSPDARYAVDLYSRMDTPPAIASLSIDNPQSTYITVDTTDVSLLKAAGWTPPTLFTVKAADGVTDLPGVMYLPSNLDINKKYPIITNVYPGPQDDQIFRYFAIDDNYNQSLAELGFVVITAPSRGSSPLRGRDFYTYGYRNFRDYPLEDDRNTIMQLAERYPFIDLDRVGIYGHSGGGFQTVAAMLNYPDFYKVGIAASGNHDNNIYIQNWGEIFHGIDQETDTVTGKTVFKANIPTNQELAGNLNGRLLLIHGDVDKNVSPSHTYRLADALIKKGKRFDMFILPGKDHGVMCPYYYNLIRYYFVDHLLSPTPFHMDIINHQ